MRTSRWAWIVVLLGIWGVSHAGEPGTNQGQDAATPAPPKRPRTSSDGAPQKPSPSAKERAMADDEMLNHLDVLEDLPVLDALEAIESLQAIENDKENER